MANLSQGTCRRRQSHQALWSPYCVCRRSSHAMMESLTTVTYNRGARVRQLKLLQRTCELVKEAGQQGLLLVTRCFAQASLSMLHLTLWHGMREEC